MSSSRRRSSSSPSEPVEHRRRQCRQRRRTASARCGSTWRARTRCSRSRSACATAPPRKAACSRCARRSACPKARSASSASTSATRWARRRSPRAWSTIGSQMQKSEYRRFNIRDVTPGDDYAAMRQVLARRYERVTAEAGKIPDLILIDGGKGQVGVAAAVLHDLGLHQVCVVGVAKGPERKPGEEELILEAQARTLQLAPSHPGLHLIQAIRDEAHRFAVVGPPRAARQGAHHLDAERDPGHRREAPPGAALGASAACAACRRRRSTTSPRWKASAARSPSASTSTCTDAAQRAQPGHAVADRPDPAARSASSTCRLSVARRRTSRRRRCSSSPASPTGSTATSRAA